jgi:hypothetical protein
LLDLPLVAATIVPGTFLHRMRRNDLFSVITFLATLAFALVAAKLLAPKLIGRDATAVELSVIAVFLCVLALWNRARSSRRQRQRLDQIRDSALW